MRSSCEASAVKRLIWVTVASSRASGVHVYQLADYNQAPANLPGQTLSLAGRRPVSNFGIIQISFNECNSTYNALQAKLEKRFSKGFSLLNSFAWAKALDIAPSNMESGNGDDYYMNFRNWGMNKGISDYDQKFQNTTSAIWEIPVGRHHKLGASIPGVADAIVGGWRLAGINTMLGGQPVNFQYTPSTVASVTTGLIMRPDLVGDPFLPSDQRTPQHWFNPAGLAVPAVSQPFGSAGRNIARSAPLFQLDLALEKSFPIREDKRLEFRTEAFNLQNRTNFMVPASNISNSNFGTVTSAFPARQIQFALKFVF